MNRAALCTRRLYSFEGYFLRYCRHWRDTPMSTLRRLASRAATDHRRAAPVVVAGRGGWHHTRLESYSQGDRIVLARDHRNPIITLHEVAHYLQGERGLVHGPAFVKRYFSLLVRYLGMDEQELRFSAAMSGVFQ